ncbi:GGDEF domain-containing protein [Aureimonas leprariae]|uniref:diguanylate cyclase n=1 Tax=Plantimonas leprariae TaxID=2615207 RepID=A0A7V7PMY2_9HYPH|nr:GGDEF domain-containing protein [Aureimonas leprariae]KAB0678799.1 GGDEF domain-containing protein [Aureimonas leprariae]
MFRHPFSLVTAGRIFVAASVTYVVAAALFSFSFMREIENDARFTRENQIPKILAQNANAVKVEKLASLVHSAYLARDARLERQVQLELRVLSQTFTLDNDKVLIDGAKAIADDVKRITSLRAAERGGAAVGAGGDTAEQLRTTYNEAIRKARQLADYLVNDSAFVADNVSNKIEANANRITNFWMAILAVPVLGSLLIFWMFRTHVAGPINATIDRLTAIGTETFSGAAPPAPLFVELRMISTAVETYGEVSAKLSQTNSVLRALSVEDALTGIGNRRSFDAMLDAEFGSARSREAGLAVLIIDLDHFKRINDEYGHQSGDACLQATGRILRSHCEGAACHAARYGGEEFSVLLPNMSVAEAVAFAEKLRVAIATAQVARGEGRRPIRMTASIGVASTEETTFASPGALLDAADAALYRAKHRGRNNVQFHSEGDAQPLETRRHA